MEVREVKKANEIKKLRLGRETLVRLAEARTSFGAGGMSPDTPEMCISCVTTCTTGTT
jgi:hypothetical protein